MSDQPNNETKKQSPQQSEDLLKSRSVGIQYLVPEGMPLIFSDLTFIQSNPDAFILSFFQQENPIIDNPEEFLTIESVKAYCVARIVIAPAHMQRTLLAIQDALLKFEQRKQGE